MVSFHDALFEASSPAEVLAELHASLDARRRAEDIAQLIAPTAIRGNAALACDISRRFNMSHHLADALAVLGGIELAQERYEQAVACLEESEQIWRTRGWESYHSAVRADLDRARRLAAAAAG